MWRRFLCYVVALAAISNLTQTASSADVQVEKNDRGVTIKLDGQLFTEYLTQSGAKPILWPVIGPTGKPMTRAYPMETVEGEQRDHVHQRSFWFTHGDVNGIDFWSEQNDHGTIKHLEFTRIEGGPQAVVATRNAWLGPDGRKHLEDERTLTFGGDKSLRWIDFDIVLRATEGPVVFGDTKEGTFGLRVASSMDANKAGRIINSDGLTGDGAWGKAASWVDYQGPVDGQQVGIAILNHPSSFRYPTHWHVRTYGLFAANPFGPKAFTGSGPDGYTLPMGETIVLRYRVLLHTGDEKAAQVAESFADYAAQQKEKP